MPRALRHLLLLALALPLLATTAHPPAAARAAGSGPILHEPIPPDPEEDLTLATRLDGELPTAIRTSDGLVTAPDPRRPVGPEEPGYDASGDRRFAPDRNTKRPDVDGYDDPFTPSTAPFKRLEAFDSVNDRFELEVADPRKRPLTIGAQPASDEAEESFFADLVVDLAPGRRVRIPSVGPGARIVRARLGVEANDIAFQVTSDGAENWFIEGARAATRARLVMELAIPRAAFGADLADVGWSELPPVASVPERVMRSAREVQRAIGVSTAMRPRAVVTRLVSYFRSFVDSDDPPSGRGDIYLDLALSKKGVCRHRAFAFTVTALSLGIPTRMVMNEAHAWVEVSDGKLWHRIDLGGAGRMVNPASDVLAERPVHRPPPDRFGWPQGAERGTDMVEQARERARERDGQGGGSGGPEPGGMNPTGGRGSEPGSMDVQSGRSAASESNATSDPRPVSVLSLTLAEPEARRGHPVSVRGSVRADDEPCPNVLVEILLRGNGGKLLLLGTVATGHDGAFSGAIVVPGSTPLGAYDVVARTPGDARCGPGGTP